MTDTRITLQAGQKLRETFASGVDIVIWGDVNHGDRRYREFVTSMVEDELRPSNVTHLILEQPSSFKPYVDRFMAATSPEEEFKILREMEDKTRFTLRDDHQRIMRAAKAENVARAKNGQLPLGIVYLDTQLTEEERAAHRIVALCQDDERLHTNGQFNSNLIPPGGILVDMRDGTRKAITQSEYLKQHKILFTQREKVNADWVKLIAELKKDASIKGQGFRAVLFAGDDHFSRIYDPRKVNDARYRDDLIGVSDYAKDVNEMLRDRGISTAYWRLGDTTRTEIAISGPKFRPDTTPDNRETADLTLSIPDTASFDVARRARGNQIADDTLKAKVEEARKEFLKLERDLMAENKPRRVYIPNLPENNLVSIPKGSPLLSPNLKVELMHLADRAVPGFCCVGYNEITGDLTVNHDAIARLDDRQKAHLLPVLKEMQRYCGLAKDGEPVTVTNKELLKNREEVLKQVAKAHTEVPLAPAPTHTQPPLPLQPAKPPVDAPPEPPAPPREEGINWKKYAPWLLGAGGLAAGLAVGGLSMSGMLIGAVLALVAGMGGNYLMGDKTPEGAVDRVSTPAAAAGAKALAVEKAAGADIKPDLSALAGAAHTGLRLTVTEASALPGGFTPPPVTLSAPLPDPQVKKQPNETYRN